ncbi:MAG TPA: DUF5320 domain-containing protein [Firmicutes bacterium]|jgi:hypothetical protein|nr:DUF5320 domain-containing protein [Bacillota bacterium]
MPGGDGTGPRGFGPLTGWGRGYCAGEPVRGYGGFGPGFRGRRWYGYHQPQGFYQPPGAAPSEKLYLEQQAEYLKEQLKALEARLNDMKSSDD